MSSVMPREMQLKLLNASLPLLKRVRQVLSQQELAAKIDYSVKTISRWENEESACPAILEPALRAILSSFKRPIGASSFTFIDLFAGIGGMRAGFEGIGGRCVFTSEWNSYAKKTYVENYGDSEEFVGDIVDYPTELIPDHDVLLAGFPCQPFSIAGVSKKNALGRPHGFECETQGTLFFEVERIIQDKQPKAFLLENVKNLLSHDKGNTFRIIRHTLEKKLGYRIHYKVVDGRSFVPQHRERILIVGFREDNYFSFDDLVLPDIHPRLGTILHKKGSQSIDDGAYCNPDGTAKDKYILTDKLWAYLQAYAEKHRLAGNGFGFGLVNEDSVTRTLSARYYKDGSEILLSRGAKRNPRRLTPRECARLMGYEDTFQIPVSDTQAYKQFGNSVVVPVIGAVANVMAPYII